MKKIVDKSRTANELKVQAPKPKNNIEHPVSSSQVPDRLCFIVTQKKNNSWVDDLYASERQFTNDTVFN